MVCWRCSIRVADMPMTYLTPRESIEKALEFGPDCLKIDIVLGERMLSEAEALLPVLLEQDPAAYPMLRARLEEVWRDHVMNVLMFDEGEEVGSCH